MTDAFPRKLELGVLEVFREDLESCFCGCIDDKKALLADRRESGFVSVFLPLLLRRIFDNSKLSLAFILNKANENGTGLLDRYADAKKEVKLKYPVLQKNVQIIAEKWRRNTIRIMSRWLDDRDEIARHLFGSDSIGSIVGIGASSGDVHQDGQQSLLFELSCGRKLAYKPRCVDIEQAFYVFADHLEFSELYQPKFLARKDYGWMEYIPHMGCDSSEQLKDYYYQAGLMLSLLYALEAEDIHYENIIARGPQPVVVDLETLFHHRDDSTKAHARNQAHLSLGDHTVLKTHLIPQYLSSKPEVELAAIFPVFQMSTPSIASFPRHGDQFVAVDDFVDDFIKGFRAGYRRIHANKTTLISPQGPLRLFANCRARYICRPTRIYNRLLNAALHPAYQTCLSKQDTLFEKLRLDIGGRKFLAHLVNAEKQCLCAMEIPCFTHAVDRRAVFLDAGLLHSEFFAVSGLELCRNKISQMCEEDLEGQVKLIGHSFDLASPRKRVFRPNTVGMGKTDFLSLCGNTACSIGMLIWQEGIQHQDGLMWPVYRADGNGRICLDPTNSSLYEGYLGISLFLVQLQHLFPAFYSRSALIEIVKAQLNHAVENHSVHSGCGGYEGSGGLLYALSRIAKLWPQEGWTRDLGQRLLRILADTSAQNNRFDVVGGRAGAILALLCYHQFSRGKKALDIAISIGEQLVDAFRHNGQIGWETGKDSTRCGFAHGNAGIGYALMKLDTFAHDNAFIDCGLEALKYESSQYLPDIGNWPDERLEKKDEQKKNAMTAWCHGAVGIGLSRLNLQKSFSRTLPEFIALDIKRALAHLLNRPNVKCENLCHGNFGNFELLVTARRQGVLDARIGDRAIDRISKHITFVAENGLTHYVPESRTSFSLMTGWAGIGYQLLRFAHPRIVPSVLLLDCSDE